MCGAGDGQTRHEPVGRGWRELARDGKGMRDGAQRGLVSIGWVYSGEAGTVARGQERLPMDWVGETRRGAAGWVRLAPERRDTA